MYSASLEAKIEFDKKTAISDADNHSNCARLTAATQDAFLMKMPQEGGDGKKSSPEPAIGWFVSDLSGNS